MDIAKSTSFAGKFIHRATYFTTRQRGCINISETLLHLPFSLLDFLPSRACSLKPATLLIN